MSILDGILKNIGGAPDNVAGVASKVGLDPALVAQALAVLGKTHQMPGDTVATASQHTGLRPAVLNQVVAAIGGEQALGNFASVLDRDGDGNPMDDIMGMAQNLFGKR